MPSDEVVRMTVIAVKELDADGLYPDADRVCAWLEDYPEREVRKAYRLVLSQGLATIATPDDRPGRTPEPDPDDPCDDGPADPADAAAPPRPRHRAGGGERDWNQALFALVHGHRGVYRHLSVITGRSVNALKSRVKRVAHECPPDGEDAGPIDEDTVRYLEKRYRTLNDPEVREWLGSMRPSVRSHPDNCRFRAADKAPPPV